MCLFPTAVGKRHIFKMGRKGKLILTSILISVLTKNILIFLRMLECRLYYQNLPRLETVVQVFIKNLPSSGGEKERKTRNKKTEVGRSVSFSSTLPSVELCSILVLVQLFLSALAEIYSEIIPVIEPPGNQK